MRNLFRIIDNARQKHYGQFNNFVISKTVEEKLISYLTALGSVIEKCDMTIPYHIDGKIFGIDVIVDKFLPEDKILLRNNADIVAIINLEERE